MTSLPNDVVQPRPRRRLRGVTIAVVAAGVVLVPASPAFADHMPGMNGTMCPHASGEGPDALAAPGPNEPAAPAQAPSDSPVGAVSAPQASTPAPSPATDPGGPATQVTQPATQVPAQQPATVAESVGAESAAVGTVATTTTAAAPRLTRAERLQLQRERAEARRAQRQSVRVERSYVRTYAVEPFSLTRVPIGVEPRSVSLESSPSTALMWLVPVLVAIAALAGVLLARRRDSGGAVVADEHPDAPAAPSYADAAMEAELHEMIAEARAREVLAADQDGEAIAHR